MKRILIIGATSAIASECARLWAAQGASLFLVGRDASKLEELAADSRVRGAAAVRTWQMDVTDLAAHTAMFESAVRALNGFDVALIAHGTLPDQSACERDPALMVQEFTTNGVSVMALLTLLAPKFEQQASGSICVITSVAGDRGRPSNYVYGSAKAAVSVFCEGMRARLFRAGVSLTDIRPGFVDTPMTQGLALPALLLARPGDVARKILIAIERRRDVAYVPAFWAVVMTFIRMIPGAIFKRMTL